MQLYVLNMMFPKSLILGLAVLTLLAVSPSLTPGQVGRPAAEFHSLMNMRFSEREGEFLVDGLQIVFPPAGDAPAIVSVERLSGEEMFRLPLQFDSYLSFPLFGNVVPIDAPGRIKIAQSGDFVLTIKVVNQVITRLPFTLKSEPSNDPYDLPKRFVRDGPWRDLAYFSVPLDDPGGELDFNWWMSLRELPTGMTNPLVKIRLMRGSQEISSSRDGMALDKLDWQFFTSQLVETKKSGARYFTLSEFAKRDGDYMLIVEANGTPIKSYQVVVRGGQLQRPDQSRLDFEPHADFISPRLIDTSPRSASHDPLRDIYWVRRAAVIGTFPHRDSVLASRNPADQQTKPR
jgi:hypothetical protein